MPSFNLSNYSWRQQGWVLLRNLLFMVFTMRSHPSTDTTPDVIQWTIISLNLILIFKGMFDWRSNYERMKRINTKNSLQLLSSQQAVIVPYGLMFWQQIDYLQLFMCLKMFPTFASGPTMSSQIRVADEGGGLASSSFTLAPMDWSYVR